MSTNHHPAHPTATFCFKTLEMTSIQATFWASLSSVATVGLKFGKMLLRTNSKKQLKNNQQILGITYDTSNNQIGFSSAK